MSSRSTSSDMEPLYRVENIQVNWFRLFYKTTNYMLESGIRLFDIPEKIGYEEGLKKLFTSLLPKNLSAEMMFFAKLIPLEQGKFYAADFERLMFNQSTKYLHMFVIQYPAAPTVLTVNQVAPTETWLAVTQCENPVKINAMAVFNFSITHLIELTHVIAVSPTPQKMYWYSHYNYLGSPTTNTDLMKNPVVEQIARQYNVSASQILFLWALQRGETVVPRFIDSTFYVETMALNGRISQEDLLVLDYVGVRLTGGPLIPSFEYGAYGATASY